MTSILILVAMVGAVVLARREARREAAGQRATSMPTLNDYLVLSAVLFTIGTAGVFLRRNLITILLSIEIMLNAVNLTFVAFGRALGIADGQIIVFFVMTVAAAEAAVGLAIVIALFRHRESLNPDRSRLNGEAFGRRHEEHEAPIRLSRVFVSSWLHSLMLLLIPLLPFVGFLLNAGLGRRLGKSRGRRHRLRRRCSPRSRCRLAVGVAVGRAAAGSRGRSRRRSSRGSPPASSGRFTLRLDPLSALMILVVTGIGSLIHIYSTAYMHEERDPEYARYFSYLNLFAAFMLVLVLGANFLVMFVGWEGVGLCSYLLIGFWYQKKSAADAGKKAFIVNRIGDFGFILGVLLIVRPLRHARFPGRRARRWRRCSPEAAFGPLSLITLLLFVGATGKSAQIPLYVWLPDAMEGPTPVSALIHAATMVTAGVYMIGRNAVLFSHAPETLAIVAVIGAATALLAGTIGLVQNDIKRVLAYSTVSQLGYMFLAMGVGAYTRRHLPPLHPRVLQGAAVPRIRRGDSRAGRRAGLAAHGRAQEGAADHLLDVPGRRAGDCGRAAAWPASSARTRSCSAPSPAATPCCGSSGC